MDAKQNFNHNVSIIGWGALFVWWGVCFMIGPITLAMGAMGTGLILLGVNVIRVRKGIKPVVSTTIFGIGFLAWGALDQARLMTGFPLETTFPLALVVIGLCIWLTPLLRRTKAE